MFTLAIIGGVLTGFAIAFVVSTWRNQNRINALRAEIKVLQDEIAYLEMEESDA